MMEFHISRKARERYQFAESLFSYSGNVVFANLPACREFAHRMNTVRDVEKYPERAVHAGQLYAMGLIDEASHVLMARYREQFDPQVMTSALEWFAGKVGAEELGKMLVAFVEQFPGMAVIRGEKTPLEWLAGETAGTSHWAVAFEELILLWTANRNEAFDPFKELFEEKTLAEKTVYRKVTRQLPDYFATRPLIPLPDARPMNLLELLRAPAVGAPRSLADQLALIRKLWRPLIGDSLEKLLAIAAEVLREEELAIWMQFNPHGAGARRGHGLGIVATAEVPEFGDALHEYEKFSPDQAWMPTAVLIAKSTYVWLAQMSRRYGRWIKRLDEIPNEELATLARRGLNTLWLIGVWERSRASKTIKQLCGNSDAVASAYSLYDYAIASDLGGEAAYVNLRDRAFHHGIRLASDMVPNHMGIDSPWVVEHPDWFIARPEPPYPAYSFNGPDLSQDGRVEIKIDDHYFSQSDAAVVFQRRDRSSGETRYIYHGNDGTSYPWNDTAQLDYLNPAVREQVIQTILHVARLFPVIRFDAAMTLAKRHFHRLWFPGPGASGAIPSRAESGMSQADFDRAMPHEFWREVVDRVAAEVPGTLLLAEAFWLMEGYFVRTLGMHRVYNSAFMVMLRDEDNAKYRSVIKKTIEFDPDIMKRYVNFMSNPDERTAIDQFGKGDKCFGVATMMATLPGLPMFGHGQIEGFTEKYGMEYQRPRYDESPDPWLVERHEREIAPLLKRRRLFAESGNFLLYDFYHDSGSVDENVFAYSNRSGNDRALVVFNNRYGETRGTIDFSAAYADKAANQLRQRRIAEGLGFGGHSNAVLAWRDSLTGLEYLRRASDLSQRGLTLNLHAYQCHVFLDWCELYSTQEKPWDRLADQLNGRGVPSLEDALVYLELQPVHDALRALLDPALVRRFADLAEHPRTVAVGVNTGLENERTSFFNEAWMRCENFLRAAQKAYLALIDGPGNLAGGLPANPGLLGAAFRARLRAAMRIPAIESLFPEPWTVAARRMLPSPSLQFTATAMWGPVLAWCVLELLAESFDAAKPEPIALDLFDRLRLREPFGHIFAALGFEGEEPWRVAARIKILVLTAAGIGKPKDASSQLNSAVHAPAGQASHGTQSGHTGPVLPAPESAHAMTGTPDAASESGHDFNRAGDSAPAVETRTEEASLASTFDSSRAEEPPTSPSALAPEGDKAPFAPALWLDPDIRWLTGVHSAEGNDYLVREPYEELLWWLQMPRLLRLAGETTPGRAANDRAVVEAMSRAIDEAITAAEAAGYRVDRMMASAAAAATVAVPAPETEKEADTVAASEAETETESAIESFAESACEPVAEPVAEPQAEPEQSAKSGPVPADEPEPFKPGTEPAVEPISESATESAPAIEPAAEETLEAVVPEADANRSSEVEPHEALPPESPKASEASAIPGFEPEPDAESVAQSEPETATVSEPLPAEDSEPLEEKPDLAVEQGTELAVETTPESPVEAASEALVEASTPEIDGALGAKTEPEETTPSQSDESIPPESLRAPDSLAAAEPEPEAEIVEQPQPNSSVEPEPAVPVEPEPAPNDNSQAPAPAIEIAAEAAPDSDADDVIEVHPISIEPAQSDAVDAPGAVNPEDDNAIQIFTGPVSEAAVEPAAEPQPEPKPAPKTRFPVLEEFVRPESEQPAEPATDPVFRLSDFLVAKPKAGPTPDASKDQSAVEPAAPMNAEATFSGHVEPPRPVIDSDAEPAAESATFLKLLTSLNERWEPPAPKIDFVARPATGTGTDSEQQTSPEELREHSSSWSESEAKPAREPRTLAEMLHAINAHWEPPAPKVEFAAKSPAELNAERESAGHGEPAKPEPETPQDPTDDPGR